MNGWIRICIWIVLFLIQLSGFSQELFSVKVSQDTVLLGNRIEVSFHIENVNGQFEAPKFNHFQQVGGVRQSSNISIVNGQMTQSQSYSYILEPLQEGICIIEPAFLHLESDILLTDPMDIYVMPNPDGLKQLPQSKKNGVDLESIHKKKRPVTKL